jgi:universal stress protein E
MHHFKNILLVLQGHTESPAAFQRAVSLARANNALLTVISIAGEEAPTYVSIPLLQSRHLKELVLQEELEWLEAVTSPLSDEGIQVVTSALVGTPFIEIIQLVLRNGHDLVMISGQHGDSLRDTVFGSTAMHLIRKCPCPVWVVNPSEQGRYRRIIAAVDPLPREPGRDSLNNKIMELAVPLAAAERAELHIVHAWSLYGEALLRGGRANLPADEVDKIHEETEQLHRSHLEQLARQYPLEQVRHKLHLVKGEAGQVIHQLAESVQAELILMGTVARTGIPGFLIGNTAEEVLHQVRCAVLTVKPDGFITPVQLAEALA